MSRSNMASPSAALKASGKNQASPSRGKRLALEGSLVIGLAQGFAIPRSSADAGFRLSLVVIPQSPKTFPLVSGGLAHEKRMDIPRAHLGMRSGLSVARCQALKPRSGGGRAGSGGGAGSG